MKTVQKPATPYGTNSYLAATSRTIQQSTKTQQVDSARLSNVEHSVATMNDKFLTEEQVKELIKQSRQETINPNITMTPHIVQDMIDKTLNGQPLHALLDPNFEPELNNKINSAVSKIQLPQGPTSDTIQSMINASISSSSTEINNKINNIQNQGTTLETNVNRQLLQLSKSFKDTVNAFTKQSGAILEALNKQPIQSPAIRIPDGPGANVT